MPTTKPKRPTSKTHFRPFALTIGLLSNFVLVACGGGLVEPVQPTVDRTIQSRSDQKNSAQLTADRTIGSPLQEMATAFEFEQMLLASKAFSAATELRITQETKLVLATVSSAGAALLDKKALFSTNKLGETSNSEVIIPTTVANIQPLKSGLGSTFDYLSTQVASLTAKIGVGGSTRTGSSRHSVTTPPTIAPGPQTPVSPANPNAELRWSDPKTWGGILPNPGADIVIPAGRTIILDISPEAIGALRVEGVLKFDRRDINLTAASIFVKGALQIGSPSEAYRNKAVITLTGTANLANDGLARAIVVDGGQLEMYGTAPSPVWTKLNANAPALAKNFRLRDSTNWRAGDVVAIAPTDYYGVSQTERLVVAQANGAELTTNSAIAQPRWGVLQYVTSNGMSLTPELGYTPPALPAPTILDQRAAVGNLSRNIVIQSMDDDAWRTKGFGVHLMFMRLNSKIVLDGVEIHRAGQAGITGRYPIHWHRLSYSDSGVVLGDAVGHVIQNSTIWESSNRCVVIHATNGVAVRNNICQDIKGHAFFLEDAVERRNVFEGNLALMIRKPSEAAKLQVHEGDVYQAGPSGFWLTNPDNVVNNNIAGDATGNGFWMAFPVKPLGLSAAVDLRPNNTPHGKFEGNFAHSNRGPGVLLSMAPIDAAGNVGIVRYQPSSDGSTDASKRVRFELKRLTSYKNLDGAYKNVAAIPDYVEWVTADNVGVHMSGSVDAGGTIERGLFVGTSLNSATPYPNIWPYESPSAIATYHSAISVSNNTIVNFPLIDGKTSGMFKANDYYLRGVDKGQVRNVNNRLINSSAGYRILPPNLDGQPLDNRNWTYSGALWDPNGMWGPINNYIVYDVPFLTQGKSCQRTDVNFQNGLSCVGQFYGIGNFNTDFDSTAFLFKSPIAVSRQEINGAEVGQWTVGEGTQPTLPNMRHFAATNAGIYVLRFPGKPLPKLFAMDISNALTSADSFIFAVSFDGKLSATGYAVGGDEYNRLNPMQPTGSGQDPSNLRRFKAAQSLEEVRSSSGDKLWQDTANNLVWLKYIGGQPQPYLAMSAEKSDPDIYRISSVVIFAK